MRSQFARFYLRIPRYVSRWLRTTYMHATEKANPIRLPLAHPVGKIIYAGLVSNARLKRLSPICYSAQMFGFTPDDIPEDKRHIYPTPEDHKEFTAFAIYEPHYFAGEWIGDGDTMQLNDRAATKACRLLTDEMFTHVDRYWEEYKRMKAESDPGRTPHYYDCLLDFCEFYDIDVDAVDALYRALKRRRHKEKKEGEEASSSPAT